MGRPKEYRQRLKYQVNSVRKKTLKNRITSELKETLALSEVEAELLAGDIRDYLLENEKIWLPGQMLISGTETINSFYRGRHNPPEKLIRITPVHQEDLDLKAKEGIKVMKFNRILRVIEEAARQDSLLTRRQLTLLFNLTPTALRSRFKRISKQQIFAPTAGMSKKQRKKQTFYRSTILIKEYLESKGDLKKSCHKLFLPRMRAKRILKNAASLQHSSCEHKSEEEKQWLNVLSNMPADSIEFLLAYHLPEMDEVQNIRVRLKEDYSFSPVMIRAIMLFLQELKFKLNTTEEGRMIYHAVSDEAKAGMPLDECELIPVEINFLLSEDETCSRSRDLNRLKEIKLEKIYRYAEEAAQQGAYLTYADLSFLMSINSESLRNFVKTCDIKPPLRGYACDIGRGISHKREIIELYLKLYTETEIVQRSGHSYDAIEEYIRDFAVVYLLYKRGLAPPMIRKATGRSQKLINSYLDLIYEYDKPEYAFKFHHLEQLALREREEPEKKGPKKP